VGGLTLTLALNVICTPPQFARHRLVSSGNDGTLKVFDLDHGNQVASFDTDVEMRCVAFDGQFVLAGCEDGTLRLWDVVQGVELAKHAKHDGSVMCASHVLA
jgi:WD40 repeat protein